MYTLKGTLTVKGPVQQISDSFKKRDFVVKDESGQYAQTIQFQVVQDRCDILDKVLTGQPVEVTFFLRGREWTNPKDGVVKYFNTLDAWKVEALIDQKINPTTEKTTENIQSETSEGDDDLPF